VLGSLGKDGEEGKGGEGLEGDHVCDYRLEMKGLGKRVWVDTWGYRSKSGQSRVCRVWMEPEKAHAACQKKEVVSDLHAERGLTCHHRQRALSRPL
jgi:hypothetical protein